MSARTALVKDALGSVALLGLVAIVIRLLFGLGASTALSDAVPWGLWKILNMVAGVALATGGFTLACAVYVLGLQKYRALLRPAILIAFLGYSASCFALFLDIGLPHRIWHAIVYWNHHSFLFEVAWCVMLYLAVTAIEMTPVFLEKSRYKRLLSWLHRASVPVVIIGITLSTLHHSSLGSLFLITPTRLHELWYTPWLPILFFVSAAGAGMMFVVLVTQLYAWLKEREPKQELLRGVAVAAAVVLALLLALKVTDITRRGAWGTVLSGSVESWLFITEALLASVIPCLLLAIPKVRHSATGLATASSSAVVGLLLNRLNVGIFGYVASSGVLYVPSSTEWGLSLGILSLGALALVLVSERFDIFGSAFEPKSEVPANAVVCAGGPGPLWHLLSRHRLRHATLLPVVVLPLGTLLYWGGAVRGYPLRETPVAPPRAIDADRATLRIDGDADGDYVLFDHARHRKDLGEGDSCQRCHHLSMPGDAQTPCHRCHTDMHQSRSIFNHDHHTLRVGRRLARGLPTNLSNQSPATVLVSFPETQWQARVMAPWSIPPENLSCSECHELGEPRTSATAKNCSACHGSDMGATATQVASLGSRAPGYVEAMHAMCIKCHEEQEPTRGRARLGECQTCHERGTSPWKNLSPPGRPTSVSSSSCPPQGLPNL